MKKFLLILSLALAGCQHVPDQPRNSLRANAPQSEFLRERNRSVGVADNSAVLLVLYKHENVLHMYRHNGVNYIKTATFDICVYSGGLGPKKHTGDKQAPEGFYEIKPYMMNPGSREWLSFDTGFPNEHDRANRWTGSSLMVHGGCSSIGCFAIKDGPMQDLYAAMRDAFAAGQKQIQLQIYPYDMNNMWGPYNSDLKTRMLWHQLRQGHAQFVKTQQPVNYSVVGINYQINN